MFKTVMIRLTFTNSTQFLIVLNLYHVDGFAYIILVHCDQEITLCYGELSIL